MAYFSNSTEGDMYEAQWCHKCLHQDGCTVLLAHALFNYDEYNNKNSILHILIPRSKDGIGNEKCTMFVDRGLMSNLALQKFECDK